MKQLITCIEVRNFKIKPYFYIETNYLMKQLISSKKSEQGGEILKLYEKKNLNWLNDLIETEVVRHKYTKNKKYVSTNFKYKTVEVLKENGTIQELNFENLIYKYYRNFKLYNHYSKNDFKVECYFIFLTLIHTRYKTVDDFYFKCYISLRNKLKDLIKRNREDFDKKQILKAESDILSSYNTFQQLLDTSATNNDFIKFYNEEVEKHLTKREFRTLKQLEKLINENGEISSVNYKRIRNNRIYKDIKSYHRFKNSIVKKILKIYEERNIKESLTFNETLKLLEEKIYSENPLDFEEALRDYSLKNESIYYKIIDNLTKYEVFEFEEFLTNEEKLLQKTLNKISRIIIENIK